MSSSDSSSRQFDCIRAVALRRRQRSKTSNTKDKYSRKRENEDIDEEIRRLEAELQQDDSVGSSSSEEDSSDEEDAVSGSGRGNQESSRSGFAVLCLSTVKDDRIEPLPTALLPTNKRRALKGIDETQDQKKPPKRRQTVSQGLQGAIKEVLDGYIPRSAEKLPFYCRVCAKQFGNEKEWVDHKQTVFHKTAVEVERKASYCKLCRKQMTSPAQFKEHIVSRPHRERMERVKSISCASDGRGHGNRTSLQGSTESELFTKNHTS